MSLLQRKVGDQPARDGGDLSSESLVALHEPSGIAAEAYRMLRTNLFYAFIDAPPTVIAVTSANPKEGKSTTCANLAISLARADKSVLLLDCDLRRPAQHKLFWANSSPGFVDVLAGESTLEDAMQEPVPGLKLVPAGAVPPNPAEILGSRRFTDLLARVRGEYDYVLLDSPPVCTVSEGAVLARHGDGVLLVLDSSETRKRSVRQATKVLQGVGANVIGTVTNKVKESKNAGYYGYYGYYEKD